MDLQRRAVTVIEDNTFAIKPEAVERECYIRNPSDPLAILRCLTRQESAIRFLDDASKSDQGIAGTMAKNSLDKCLGEYYPDVATVASCVKFMMKE